MWQARILPALGLVAAVTSRVFAIPDVKAIPLGRNCSSYPHQKLCAGSAGSVYKVVAASTSFAAIEGNAVAADMYWTPEQTRYGFAIVPDGSADRNGTVRSFAPFRCIGDGVLEAQVDMDPGLAWQPPVVSGDPNWARSLGWSFPEDGAPVRLEPYALEDAATGTRLDGVFLGAGNVITWTFKQNWAGVYGTQYLVRLGSPAKTSRAAVGKRQIDYVPDFPGFLKVVPASEERC